MKGAALLAALAAWSACAAPSASPDELPSLDAAAYRRDVHAILETRCATLDCHGDMDRPLRLYAETGLRARDDLRDLDIEPLELEDNVRAIEAIDPGAALDEGLFVRKPLGEVEHEGGVLWRDGDAQLACVLAWVRGAAADEEGRNGACTVAADEVRLPP